jgi:hypothetical protein
MYCPTQGFTQRTINKDFKNHTHTTPLVEGELTSIGILTPDMSSDDSMLSQVDIGDENGIAPLL